MTESLWDDTTEAIQREASARSEQYAKAAVEPFLPYLTAATTRSDLENRISLQGHAISQAVETATGSPTLLRTALQEIRERWDLLTPTRAAQALLASREAASKTATQISVREEYDGDSGNTLTLWSGSFASDFEGEAVPKSEGSGYRITPAYGPEFEVSCPMRTDSNYQQVDAAIQKAWDFNFGRSRAASDQKGKRERSPSGIIHDITEQAFKGKCPTCGAALWQGTQHNCKGKKTASGEYGIYDSDGVLFNAMKFPSEQEAQTWLDTRHSDQAVRGDFDSRSRWNMTIKPVASRRTAGYAIVTPDGKPLWGMVYDSQEGAQAHLDQVKGRTDAMVPRDVSTYQVKQVSDAPNRTYDKSSPRNPFQPLGSFRDMMDDFNKPSATATCKWCSKDIFNVGTIWETKETVGRDICTQNNSTSNPRGVLGNHQPKPGTSKKASKKSYAEYVAWCKEVGFTPMPRENYQNARNVLDSAEKKMKTGAAGDMPCPTHGTDSLPINPSEYFCLDGNHIWAKGKTAASDDWYPALTKEPGTVFTTNGGEIHGLLTSNGHTYSIWVEDPDSGHGFNVDSMRVKNVVLDDASKQKTASPDFRQTGRPPASAQGRCNLCGDDTVPRRVPMDTDEAANTVTYANEWHCMNCGATQDKRYSSTRQSTTALLNRAASLLVEAFSDDAERNRLFEIAKERGDADALDDLADYDGSPEVLKYYQKKFAVNMDGYGSERYQPQQTLPAAPQDGYVDPDQSKVDKQVEDGSLSDIPESTSTVAARRLRRAMASDNSRVPGESMPPEFERDSGEDAQRAEPRTTRPRVAPTPTTRQTYVPPAEAGPDMPSAEQATAAKVARIAKQVLADNPHLDKIQARALAVDVMQRHSMISRRF